MSQTEFQTLFNTSLYCGYFTDNEWEFQGFLKAEQGSMDGFTGSEILA